MKPAALIVMAAAALSLTGGCTGNQPAASSSATLGTTDRAEPVAALDHETNRSAEAGWWTWPPATPSATPTQLKDTYSLSGDVLFGRDEAQLAPSAASQLDAVVRLAHEHPGAALDITGYTDSDGSDDHNLALSIRRAQAVGGYLTAAGIDAGRFKIAGRGAADPVAPNDSDDHKAMNRRVVITVQAQ